MEYDFYLLNHTRGRKIQVAAPLQTIVKGFLNAYKDFFKYGEWAGVTSFYLLPTPLEQRLI